MAKTSIIILNIFMYMLLIPIMYFLIYILCTYICNCKKCENCEQQFNNNHKNSYNCVSKT